MIILIITNNHVFAYIMLYRITCVKDFTVDDQYMPLHASVTVQYAKNFILA